MKHLLHLFLLLLAISFPCIIAKDAAKLVYDTDNHEVTSGGSYYVLPAEHGTGGGGLRMFHTSRYCNSLVSQAHNETDLGKPVQFRPPNDPSFTRKILLSTNITVSFDIPTTCVETMYWNVGFSQFSPSQPRDRVAVGKDEAAPYPAPLPSEFMFRIEKYDSTTKKGYKLVSCAGEGGCKDLGLYASNETTWLAISDLPFVVVFKKFIET
ncbi:unnamed protein product [Urochloa humidicola]